MRDFGEEAPVVLATGILDQPSPSWPTRWQEVHEWAPADQLSPANQKNHPAKPRNSWAIKNGSCLKPLSFGMFVMHINLAIPNPYSRSGTLCFHVSCRFYFLPTGKLFLNSCYQNTSSFIRCFSSYLLYNFPNYFIIVIIILMAILQPTQWTDLPFPNYLPFSCLYYDT